VGASRCKTFHGLPWGYELGTEGLSITIEINCLGELIKLTSVFFQYFFFTFHLPYPAEQQAWAVQNPSGLGRVELKMLMLNLGQTYIIYNEDMKMIKHNIIIYSLAPP
jgi:hypothetical protein